jgi:membrane-associated phospholipid phosphatase
MPTTFDIWVSRGLAGYLHHYPLFDVCIQSLVYHNILGGLGFAMALFLTWQESRKPQTSERFRIKIWTTVLASMLVALLATLASSLIHWPPPSRNPILFTLYPDYMDRNPNTNSFPSQSTAVYSALAAGFYSLNRKTGIACWIAVGVLVALPRMFVGGHYLSDVLAGLVIGIAGYIIARRLFEPHSVPYLVRTCESTPALQWFASVVVFLWILQVAVEFRDLAWLRRVLEYFWNT